MIPVPTDTEAPFLDLNLSITNGIVSSKIYDKRDDFNFEIVNFPFLDGGVPGSPFSLPPTISTRTPDGIFCYARIIPWTITNNIGVDAKRDFSI